MKEIQTFNTCSARAECQNHSCCFKMRDYYGILPWASAYKSFYGAGPYPSGVEQYTKNVDDLIQKYNTQNPHIGNTPNIKLQPGGTNRYILICEDFK